MKAHLRTAKVTSLIMREVPQRKKTNSQSSWHHGQSRKDNQGIIQGTDLCQQTSTVQKSKDLKLYRTFIVE